VTTLIFDCDGVISDTERDGHLPAFNQLFEEVGAPMRWTEETYGQALRIGGGKERLAALLSPELAREMGLPADREQQLAIVARWHQRKTEIYVQMARRGRLPPRPGIVRIVDEARAAGWQLAVCSTSAEPSVRAILESAVGPEVAGGFAVLAGDIVPRKKPAPDIYLLALERLHTDARDAVVVEDSRNGLLAATAAGLATIVTVNGYTADEDFDEAALVLSSLGDPGGPPTRTLADPHDIAPGAYVTLADLEAVRTAAD
jgi:HAD superfamily hydrolase (TIGR01509 family)